MCSFKQKMYQNLYRLLPGPRWGSLRVARPESAGEEDPITSTFSASREGPRQSGGPRAPKGVKTALSSSLPDKQIARGGLGRLAAWLKPGGPVRPWAGLTKMPLQIAAEFQCLGFYCMMCDVYIIRRPEIMSWILSS